MKGKPEQSTDPAPPTLDALRQRAAELQAEARQLIEEARAAVRQTGETIARCWARRLTAQPDPPAA
jgi:hypothetical protein